ncbi:MAG: phenylalanine--tRNA ligase subunit beta [Methylococcales bacterium]|jgi:phenylalanyl-tRNA synthetase beta chain|nr:phenylalanine--tRNA ligase subunit beta [Methylococcales bacterium]
MRFSEAWLREQVNPDLTTEALVEQLTMAGLEVDSVTPAAADFSGVVVGKVVAIEQHSNADNLKVCSVDVGGDEPLQIVCGANNVSMGMHVPTALVGAVLSGGFKIKKSKLRGELSFGMLCSEQELGTSDSAEGLMVLPQEAPVGVDVREYLALDDTLIELDLTPNRADCLSIDGVSREVALLNKMPWQPTEPSEVVVEHQQTRDITVVEPSLCSRYLGRLIKGVKVGAQTPLWMQERLRRSGHRSLGPLVDITNYILLELGQPLHAFDADKLSGQIAVRYAKKDEKIILLNDQSLTLSNDVLVIADDRGPIALAGVMGGKDSAVGVETVDIFLECAFFTPEMMMGKARDLGLHTDSSHRFERGVDPFIQRRAIERASQMIIDIAGGCAGPIVELTDETYMPKRLPVLLREERIAKVLGVAMPAAEVEDIFQRLGMVVERQDNGWAITPPGFRFDIVIEADLIEELGRVYGYNNLPQQSLLMHAQLSSAPETVLGVDRIKDLLVDRGYQEAITYSFVDEKDQQKVAPEDRVIALKNPISSELSVMRTTIWCGLLNVAHRNVSRQHSRVRLFEAGLCFKVGADAGEVAQEKMLAGLVLGSQLPEQWGESSRKIDFYDVKADLEAIFALNGIEPDFVAQEHPALHPGQTAAIKTKTGALIGWLGVLHPSLEKHYGFDSSVFLFELKQEFVLNKGVPKFTSLSKLPSVRRDLALIVDENMPVSRILAEINGFEEEAIKEVIVFDIYQGEGIEVNKKSIGLGVFIQNLTQTMTDTEIDGLMASVLDKLTLNLNAKLRD